MNPKCHAMGEGGLSMPMWKCCQCQIQLPMTVVVPEIQATQIQRSLSNRKDTEGAD